MKKIDIHTHSNEISRCGQKDIYKVIDLRKSIGLDGMVITNHSLQMDFDGIEKKQANLAHCNTFLKGLEYAKKIGFKLFLGVEVTINDPEMYHILILGCDKKFFEEAPILPKLTQKELYEYAKKHDCFVIQAHPYRDNCLPANPKYMDAIEINCRESDIQYKDKVKEFALKHNLKIVAGTDFHGQDIWPYGGIYLPNNINTNTQLRNYLNRQKKIKYFC